MSGKNTTDLARLARLAGGSIYRSREDDPQNPYGTFDNQQLLGQRCVILCTPIEDPDPRAKDMLGAVMRRGMAAIHVSGLDPFGKPTGPGFVRELCLYEVRFYDPEKTPAGLGCDGEEPAAIVTWDGTWDGAHHEPRKWSHHGFWSGTDHYVSLQGVYERWMREGRGVLTPRRVCEWIDADRAERLWKMAGDRLHESAIRRLLEGMVEVTNVGAVLEDPSKPLIRTALRRAGRWGYTW